MVTPEPSTDIASWEADVVLADGSTAHIRGIRPADQEGLIQFHSRLSERSAYYRFFSAMPRLSPVMAERFTNVDFADRVAFVVERGDTIIAVARYDRQPGSDEAEVAFTVEDRHQGQGLATLLLEYLTVAAKVRGIRRFVAEVLPQNNKMLRVFRDAGFAESVKLEDGVVRISLSLEDTSTQAALVHERERRAEARSVARLLAPRSIAVLSRWDGIDATGGDPPDPPVPELAPGSSPIGDDLSPNSGTGEAAAADRAADRAADSAADGAVDDGAAVLANLVAGGFQGPVYPVAPGRRHVGSIPAYETVAAIPGEVDLAIVTLPPGEVLDAIADCAAKGVHALLVHSLGFSDSGPAGQALEREVVAAARRNGMRLLGPGSYGAINAEPSVSMNATASAPLPRSGSIAVSSQSGALGLSLLREVGRRGLGLSSFVAVGNKADVSGNDLLQYWESDPATDVILLYLESFGNPRKFSRVARRVSRVKPIVAVKSGRSAVGARAASARFSSSTTGTDIAVDALFRQTGVIRVDTLSGFFDVGQLLSTQPLPAGRRVAIVANAGGPAILAADAGDSAGLEIPPLHPDTVAGLGSLLPGLPPTDNPVNVTAAATPATFGAVLDAVLADPGIDAAIAIYLSTRPGDEASVAAAIGAAAAAAPDKPVVVTYLGAVDAADPVTWAVPVYPFPEPAAHALGHAAAYAEWRRTPLGTIPTFDDLDLDAARAVLTGTGGDDRSAPTAAGPDGTAPLDPVATDALLAAAGIPRAQSGGDAASTVNVQMHLDAAFGPLITLDQPGQHDAEQRFRLVPLTDTDAADLVHGRPDPAGGPGADSALEQLLLRVAQLVDGMPQLVEVDLEVRCDAAAGTAGVSRARVVVGPGAAPDLQLRRLR